MYSSIKLSANKITVPPQPIKKDDKSFHVDRGSFVCNGCGKHFPNLILFENHTHKYNSRINMPPKKSVPQNADITFDDISHEEMMEAFYKMPELEGCSYKDGSFLCCQCGEEYENPYLLFSHIILHPLEEAAHEEQTDRRHRNVRKVCENRDVRKVCENWDVQNVCENRDVQKVREMDSSEGKSDSSAHEPKGPLSSSYLQSVMKVVKNSGEEKQMVVKVPWMSMKDITEKNPVKGQASRMYIYNMHVQRSEWPDSDYKNLIEVAAYCPDKKEIGRKVQNSADKNYIKDPGGENCSMPKIYSLPCLSQCKTDGCRYYCDRCSESFSNPYKLFTHKIYHENVGDTDQSDPIITEIQGNSALESIFGCNGFSYCKVEKEKYFCDICGRSFTTQYFLRNHKLCHENVETTSSPVQTEEDSYDDVEMSVKDTEDGDIICYECNLCRVQFKNLDDLASHIEAHTREAENTEDETDNTESEQQADPSGPGMKRNSINHASSSTDGISTSSEEGIKKEPVRVYPGERTAVQSESPGNTLQTEVNEGLVQHESNDSVIVKMPLRRQSKRTVCHSDSDKNKNRKQFYMLLKTI